MSPSNISSGESAALATQPAPAEPVAWRYQVGATTHLCANKLDHYFSLDDGQTYIKGEPLVLAPQPAESQACASVGVEPDLPPANYVLATWGDHATDDTIHNENGYTEDQMRQQFNAGREFEAERIAALASPVPSVGEPVAAFRALLRAEVDATIDVSGDVARQEAQIDEADHLLVKFNELFPEAP